jgi:MYXO-CTERM domain-containing protein
MRYAALLALLCAVPLVPAVARAHGRQPSLGQIAFDPSDPQHLVIRGTWAFLTSRDDGAHYTWTCALAVGYDRTIEDPRVAVLASGRVLAGTFDGLSRSDPSGCSYELVTDPAVAGLLVIDVVRDPAVPSSVWVATSPGDRPNTILFSTDEGATFETRGSFPMGTLIERVVVAPSDPSRVYVSGVTLRTTSDPRRGYVWRSTDGGRTFMATEIPLIDVDRTDYGERNVHVMAVDPTNPDVVFARTVRRTTDNMVERLLRSEDGGATFHEVAAMGEITGVVVSDDGTHVWAGSWYATDASMGVVGGLHRSDDRGQTFSALDPTLAVRCLAYRTGELWVCTDDVAGPFALGRSTDLGQTLTPLWTFSDATNDVGCGTCSQVGTLCPAYWPDVEFDLGLPTSTTDALPPDPDASIPASCTDGGGELDAAFDAGIDAASGPAPRANCGCSAASRTTPGWSWMLAALVLLARRRRPR